MITKRFLFIVMLVLLVAGVTLPLACAKPSQAPAPTPAPAPPKVEYHWKYASPNVDGTPSTNYGLKLAELLDQKSGGQIKLEVYPFGTLGEDADIIQLLMDGGIEFEWIATAFLTSQIPELNVLLLNYLMPEDERTTLEALNGGEFFKLARSLYREKGMELLGFTSIGWLWMTSNKQPIKKMDDLKGQKIRVMPSPIIVESYKAYGANPTPLPFGEVYSGLQLGLIDGQENPIGTIYPMKFHEVLKYLTDARHLIFIQSNTVNLKFIESLPKDIRDIVYEASREAQDYTQEWTFKYNEETKALMLKEKPELELYELPPEEIEKFREAVLPVREVFLQKDVGGDRAKEVLDALIRDAEKARAK